MRVISSRALKYFLIVYFFSVATVSNAIIIRHDKADSRYRVDETAYPQIFFLHTRYGNKVCMATLISSQWAITAAHCTEQTPIGDSLSRSEAFSLYVAGKPNKIIAMTIHPDYGHSNQSDAVDLALIKLERKVNNVVPAKLYLKTDEEHQVLSLFGWGYTGIGTLGSQGNDRKFRRAQNEVTEAGHWLRFSFDDPRILNNTALPLEGVPGLGDSGGPAILETQEGMLIVGVALGEIENSDNPEARQGRYGAIELYERISSHLEWINAVIGEKE